MTADGTPALLRLDDVSGGYGNLSVLHGISLELAPGRAVGVLGPNAAGKTTLLRAIMGLLPEFRGRVYLDGVDIAGLPAHRRARLGLGLVPEGRGLFGSLTATQHLQLAPSLKDMGRSLVPIDEIFELLPVLADRRNQQAGLMSGGEQQMLAIARALRLNPKVLIMDEPSSGLAPLVVEQVFESIVSATGRGVGVILVEQQSDLALDVVDDVMVLGAGSLVLAEKAEDVSRQRLQQAYLGLAELGRDGGQDG